MPQLMPLNWVFSSFMMVMIVICAGIIYSEVMIMSGVQNCMSSMNERLNNWCW